jgi:chemotaxis protein MotB
MTVLLLAFFVLLLGMTVKDQVRMRKALGSVAGVVGRVAGEGVALAPGGEGPAPVPEFKNAEGSPGEALRAETVKAIAAGSGIGPDAVVLAEDGKVRIRMQQAVLFEAGSGDLNQDAREFLAALSDRLRRSSDDVEVGGHADPFESLDNPYWPGNSWELSIKRAQVVYNFLVSHGIDAWRLSFHGFGATRPVVDSVAQGDSCSENARVELSLGTSHTVPSQMREGGRKVRRSAWYEQIDYKDFLFKLFPAGENKH